MLAEALLRYLHFTSLFVLVASVLAEWRLLKPELARREIKRLAKIDSLYGFSAITAVGAGLALWLGVGKPAEFYSDNWIFILKVSMAILLGLLSAYPTIFFFQNRKGADEELVAVPKILRAMVLLEVLLLVFIPLCATLMARGYGG